MSPSDTRPDLVPDEADVGPTADKGTPMDSGNDPTTTAGGSRLGGRDLPSGVGAAVLAIGACCRVRGSVVSVEKGPARHLQETHSQLLIFRAVHK